MYQYTIDDWCMPLLAFSATVFEDAISMLELK